MPNILVVEDDPGRAALARRDLEDQGFEVRVAPDAGQADAALAAGCDLLLVSDALGAGDGGHALCRRVKADPSRQGLPVVLLTSFVDPAHARRGLDCGADLFVPALWRPESLVGMVRRALGGQGGDRAAAFLDAACEAAARGTAAAEGVADAAARFRPLFEGNPHAMWVYEPATLRLLAVNDAAAARLGYTREELLALSVPDLIAPGEVARLGRELSRPRARLHYAGFWQVRRKDGGVLQMELTSHELAPAGRPVRVVLAVDMTEPRRLEERLRQSEKMEAVGRLAGGVAHEFNNLLTVINGYGEMALKQLPAGHPAREMVREMVTAGDRAAGLTRQLLAFSRHQVVEPRVLDLHAAVRDAEGLLRRLIGEHIELVVVSDGGTAPVLADPGQLQQILLNLCVNARDAMPRGGRLIIETRRIDLDEAHAREHPGAAAGPHVLLAVSDSGHGMTEEVKARVFEPFFTTKEVGKGSGIGLATVYGAVRMGRGHISLSSAVGRGTTFRVYFPRAAGEPQREAPKSRSAVLAGAPGRETVLVAEDDDAVRAIVRRVLQTGATPFWSRGTARRRSTSRGGTAARSTWSSRTL